MRCKSVNFNTQTVCPRGLEHHLVNTSGIQGKAFAGLELAVIEMFCTNQADLFCDGHHDFDLAMGYLSLMNHFQGLNQFGDPGLVIGRSDGPIMIPGDDFECRGFVDNVIFPTGLVDRGDTYQVFYGAADACVGVVEWSKSELMNTLR